MHTWSQRALELAMQGITAVLLSLKKKPVIRYEKMSPMAKKLGLEIQVSSALHTRPSFSMCRCSTGYNPNLPYSISG
jgi:hypothetical protein